MSNVQGNFSLLTTQNRASLSRSQYGTGMHKIDPNSSLFSAPRVRAQSRYGYNNRFNDPNLNNRFAQGESDDASKKFDWGNGLATGATSALSGAVAGSAINVPWGTIAGAVVGFVGGLFAGGRSGG